MVPPLESVSQRALANADSHWHILSGWRHWFLKELALLLTWSESEGCLLTHNGSYGLRCTQLNL